MTKTHKIFLGVAVVAILSLTVAYAITTGAGNARKAIYKAHSSTCTAKCCSGDKATALKTENCCKKDAACCCADGCGCCDGCKGGTCDCEDCKCCDCCKKDAACCCGDKCKCCDGCKGGTCDCEECKCCDCCCK